MTNVERIVRYTIEELEAMDARGEVVKTDTAYLDALTDEELEASIDFEEEGIPDFSMAQKGIPSPPDPITLRVDRDVIAWFAAQGPGPEERMARVLRDRANEQRR